MVPIWPKGLSPTAAFALSSETATVFWVAKYLIDSGDKERTALPMTVAAIRAILRMFTLPLG